MITVSRRGFLSVAATTLVMPHVPCVSATKPSGEGERLFRKYFSVHSAPENPASPRGQRIEHYRHRTFGAVSEYLDDVAKIIGVDPLEARLADLAKHNPITPKSIPLIFSEEIPHSHNILPGLPYTGVAMGPVLDYDTIAAHEVGHIVFGKFNDALTEPLASLFVRPNPSPGGPPPNGGGGQPPREPLPIRFNEAVLLAVLQLWDDGHEIADARSIRDLFLHRPTARLVAETHYQRALSEHADNTSKAAEATHEFLSEYIRRNYEQDFRPIPSLNFKPLSAERKIELDDWFRREAAQALAMQSRNPNESRGFIRAFHGLLDVPLTHLLLHMGLPEGEPNFIDELSPEKARASIGKYLRFYFNPFETVREYGVKNLDELQHAIRTELEQRGRRLTEFAAWFDLKESLPYALCYQPRTWNDCDCVHQDRSSNANFDAIVSRFMNRMRGRLLPGGPGLPNPIVERAKQNPDGRPLLSLTHLMGQDLDFETYFGLV